MTPAAPKSRPSWRKRLFLPSALAAVAALAPASLGSGTPLTGHSHWDDPNANVELRICYLVKANTSSAGTMIFHIPFREVDVPDFYDLQAMTNGFKLTKRISNVSTTISPSFSTKQTFGVGSGIMFDFVASGSTFTLYQLLGTPTAPVRGPMWYQWHDSTYSKGVNISYYTVKGWDGVWQNVFDVPQDSLGTGHEIHNLEQDARSVVGSGTTFDSVLPASGSVKGITASKNGSTATYGLPSGANYTYTFNVSQPGTGHVDFRDPSAGSQGQGPYFANGYYRLTLGTTPQIQRYSGTGSAGQKWSAPAASGVAGTYTLALRGTQFTLTGPTGKTLLAFSDSGPTWGVRLRISPGNQTWDWSGAPS